MNLPAQLLDLGDTETLTLWRTAASSASVVLIHSLGSMECSVAWASALKAEVLR